MGVPPGIELIFYADDSTLLIFGNNITCRCSTMNIYLTTLNDAAYIVPSYPSMADG